MEQAKFEVVLGRMYWAAFRDAVREARFDGCDLDLFEESRGLVERRFVVRGGHRIIATLRREIERLKFEQETSETDHKADLTLDKSRLPPGPWHEESDLRQWWDEATDLRCLVNRNSMGALCGYVGVPEEHPWYGLDYGAEQLAGIEVHGCLTFSGVWADYQPAPGGAANVWWFGFDTCHYGDAVPATRLHPELVYRDLAYVQAECRKLAQQLAEAA